MEFTMLADQTVSVTCSPVIADGSPSTATLSNVTYQSSDPTIFIVAPDPAHPDAAIMTGVTAGTANLTASATATETDGRANTIHGAATITLSTAVPPATGLVFHFGTPSRKAH